MDRLWERWRLAGFRRRSRRMARAGALAEPARRRRSQQRYPWTDIRSADR
jgi:hypothetical protein